ncbi:PD-(D/E)XK nuclease family protein [Thioalkalivibrio thiocyanodenitrificans]|uniref:PD-(D/E)XK nuclease family protein n=1 Tax=Thioalkalivibrio thiocyanodenitrificans TaxID=243063 RepID=UPI000376632C|nr:PD-(D/E)XK nuclease family protein [Thioalkalivibrio thiocyanodenitrificans]
MNPGRDSRVHGAAPGADPLAWLARRIIEDHRDQLPDLTRVTVLRPRAHGDARLRRLLLEAAHERGSGALLGPRITSMRQWISEAIPPDVPTLGAHGRELLLFESLRAHAQLFGRHDPWRLADTLLELFRELTLGGTTPPPEYEAFVERLRAAYGLGADVGRCLESLGREARIVHTLWQAWLTQQHAEGREDPDARYLRALAALDPDGIAADHLYVAGYDEVLPAEAALLGGLARAGRAHWLVPAPAAPGLPAPDAPPGTDDTPFGAFLDQVFHTDGAPLRDRALRFAERHPRSPAADRVALLAAEDAEAQAAALDIRIRAWLLEGHTRIGVVTDDRRLARRLRALLERAGIDLDDPGGWALSTTRAAAALERWLEALEEDFAYQPLMDVLKSSFVLPGHDREKHLFAVYRLEQDVMLRENIPRGLGRMRSHLSQRTRRLGPAGESGARAAGTLLDALEHAAQPLKGLINGPACPADRLMRALRDSLERLGMDRALDEDPAGRRILEELAAMEGDLRQRPLSMDWREFRTWLGRVLETRHFLPHPRPAPVQLLGLGETGLARFDALIIAAADREHLPGHAPVRALFNDGVRHALDLETWHDRVIRQRGRFRRLLEAAPRVLITWQREREGGPQRPAPWVELIDAFHRLAWSQSLDDVTLATWLDHPGAAVASPDTRPLPPAPSRPAPVLPPARVPAKLSASAHQDLIDCPYRFYAARGLGLAPQEELAEALSKADYGERVHLCLQAFHGGVADLPGPWRGPLDEAARPKARELLEAISEAVFRRDLEDNFMHRGWLARWRALIPAYLDWAIARAREWRVDGTEAQLQQPFHDALVLKGRLDRIDTGDQGPAVIDYKTGPPPDQTDVDDGEAVQLPTYALLLPDAVRVEYLQLDRDKVVPGACLEGKALAQLRDAVGARLLELVAQLRNGASVPAWGDAAVCRHCAMGVLCRRGTWTDEGDRTRPPVE